MKIPLTCLLLTLFITGLSAQKNLKQISDEIMAEGLRMYHLERASWVGTDYLLQNMHPQSIPDFAGYFTYESDDKIISTYWAGKDKPQIFLSIEFSTGEEMDISKAKIKAERRNPSKYEKLLYKIREKVNEEAARNDEFVRYDGVNYNPVYLQQKKHIEVFLLPGVTVSGVTPIGADYKFKFSKKGKLLEAGKIHRSFIPIDWGTEDGGEKEVVSSMHTHLEETGEFITPTDICTLLLYGPHGKGHQHIVIAENHVSLFNIDKRQLLILTKEAFEKIMGRE